MRKANILLIGANGYVGSNVYKTLIALGASVTPVDNFSRNDLDKKPNSDILITSYQNLKPAFLDRFTDCLWLAGHSSVAMSLRDEHGALRNNLYDLIAFSNLFRGRLIYASSGSVYSRENAEVSSELSTLNVPTNIYDYTKVSFDNYIKATGKKAIGLRFGTVNGGSARIRKELMINSMALKAMEDGSLWYSNESAARSILFIDDLVRALIAILESDIDGGIFNLASFNMTIGQIASEVARATNCEIKRKPDTPTYNFMMNTEHFEKTFNFAFDGNIEKIIQSILSDHRKTRS